MLLTLAAIAGLVSFAGRVYQNAVLRTGAVVRLRDAWQSTQADEPRRPHTRPLEKVTGMLSTPHKSSIWPAVLATAGVLTAALMFTFTHDVILSVAALLITFALARRVLQRRREPPTGEIRTRGAMPSLGDQATAAPLFKMGAPKQQPCPRALT